MTEQYIAIHNRAMQLAKRRLGITSVGALTPKQFSDLCAAAELIRRTELTQEENNIVEEHQSRHSARNDRERS